MAILSLLPPPLSFVDAAAAATASFASSPAEPGTPEPLPPVPGGVGKGRFALVSALDPLPPDQALLSVLEAFVELAPELGRAVGADEDVAPLFGVLQAYGRALPSSPPSPSGLAEAAGSEKGLASDTVSLNKGERRTGWEDGAQGTWADCTAWS